MNANQTCLANSCPVCHYYFNAPPTSTWKVMRIFTHLLWSRPSPNSGNSIINVKFNLKQCCVQVKFVKSESELPPQSPNPSHHLQVRVKSESRPVTRNFRGGGGVWNPTSQGRYNCAFGARQNSFWCIFWAKITHVTRIWFPPNSRGKTITSRF